jgi:hypothetical protein
MPLQLVEYRPFTLKTFSPLHRSEVYLTILPKLSPSQMSRAADWARERGFRVIRGRRALLSIEPTPGIRYTLAAQGWVAGLQDPLSWGREMIERMLGLPREAPQLPLRAGAVTRCSYFTIRKAAGWLDVAVNPRVEQKGRRWGWVRKRFSSALVADELYMLGLLALHAEPSRIVCWTTSALEDSQPVVTKSGLFFESRLEPDRFIELVQRSIEASPATDKVARILVAPPHLTLTFEGSSWEVSANFVEEAYRGLGGWCYDYRHLTNWF